MSTQVTSSQQVVVWLLRAWMAAALAWTGYGWWTFSGIFRWVSRWQIDYIGEYSDELSVLASFVLLAIPAGLIGKAYGVNQLVTRPLRRTSPASPYRSARLMLGLGLAALVVAAGGFAWGALPHAPPSVGEFSLMAGDAAPPQADRVTVSGIMRPRLASTFTETINGNARRTTYTPLTGPGWRNGDPVAWFVAVEQGRTVMPVPGAATPGFIRIERGEVSRNDLPGVLRDDYERAGVRLTDPHYVVVSGSELSTGDQGYVVAAVAVLFAFFLLFAALLMYARARRRLRAASDQG